VSHAKSHSDPMDHNQLGKHQKAPKSQHFKRAGAVHTSSGGVSVNVDELLGALNGMKSRATEFSRTVEKSTDLHEDLPIGGGPIAESMSAVFQHRLGSDGGVQYALNSHLTNLHQLIFNVTGNVEGYQAAEAQAAALMQGQPGAQPA
jgi:hypothetical protein